MRVHQPAGRDCRVHPVCAQVGPGAGRGGADATAEGGEPGEGLTAFGGRPRLRTGGQGIAELLSRADYPVSIGTRRPDSPKLDRLPFAVRRTTFRQAARADCVFLAVLHSASRGLVESLRDDLAGKLLVDADNAWLPGDALSAGLTGRLTEGSWMAQLLPATSVTRAFSHIDWDKLVAAATHQPDTWAAGYAADDTRSSAQLEILIRAMRYIPYRVGDLADSAALDVGGVLWPGMLTPGDMHAVLTAADESSRRPGSEPE